MKIEANNQTHEVKFYREETTCKCCGRFIRNVVEIDGVQYGTTCAESFMPRIKSFKGNFAEKMQQAERAEREEVRKALMQYAQSFNGIASKPNISNEHVNHMVFTRSDSRFYMYWLALAEARKMAS